jgi:uncharacterized protein with GYD domain
VSTAALKDQELQAYYEALFEMYGTAGWRVLMEDFARLKELYNEVGSLGTVEELWFRKGQLDVVDQMLTHQARSEAGYVLALEEQEGEAQDAPTGGVAKVIEPDAPAEPQ